MASISLLSLHPPFLSPSPHKSPIHHRRNPSLPLRSPISASQSPSSSFSHDREESRWLREEQRWLREEQRWLREESRWVSEREALLREIAALRQRVEALEREKPSLLSTAADERIAGLEALLRALKERVADGGGSRAPPPAAVLVEEADVKEMILEEIRVSEAVVERREEKEEGRFEEEVKKVEKAKGARTLRKGAEGEDVRAMQEALERLGFYSGEEDMEYSSFSSGTERAVKTWQASLGTTEDGIMTSELLKRLFMEPVGGAAGFEEKSDQKGRADSANGAAVASKTETTVFKETVTKDGGSEEIDVSDRRVFLLGENRWEEPSRLVGRDKPVSGGKAASSVKCLTCRGEGRLMCTECDGTGEPNIEPQFLEWVGEETKCPYCEGLGYTVCDVCEGKTVVKNQS